MQMRVAATLVQLACNLIAAKRLIDLACIAVSWMQNLHALAAIALQSRQFFAMRQGV